MRAAIQKTRKTEAPVTEISPVTNGLVFVLAKGGKVLSTTTSTGLYIRGLLTNLSIEVTIAYVVYNACRAMCDRPAYYIHDRQKCHLPWRKRQSVGRHCQAPHFVHVSFSDHPKSKEVTNYLQHGTNRSTFPAGNLCSLVSWKYARSTLGSPSSGDATNVLRSDLLVDILDERRSTWSDGYSFTLLCSHFVL